MAHDEKTGEGTTQLTIPYLLRRVAALEARLANVEGHLATGEQRRSRFIVRS